MAMLLHLMLWALLAPEPIIYAMARLEPTQEAIALVAPLDTIAPPEPTIAPRALGAVPSDALLFGRQASLATCGYLSASSASPLTCGSGFTCLLYTSTANAAPNFGCCTTAGGVGCAYRSACLSYGDFNNPVTGGGVYAPNDNAGFYCGSDVPKCNTIVLYGSANAAGTTTSYNSYGCTAGPGGTFTAYQLAVTSSSAASSATSGTASTSTTNPSITAVSASSSSTPTQTASSGLTTGAEIGIGVGVGVGATVLLGALGVFFFLRRQKRKKNAAEAATSSQQSGMATTGHPPHQQLYGEEYPKQAGSELYAPPYQEQQAKYGGGSPQMQGLSELEGTRERSELAADRYT